MILNDFRFDLYTKLFFENREFKEAIYLEVVKLFSRYRALIPLVGISGLRIIKKRGLN